MFGAAADEEGPVPGWLRPVVDALVSDLGGREPLSTVRLAMVAYDGGDPVLWALEPDGTGTALFSREDQVSLEAGLAEWGLSLRSLEELGAVDRWPLRAGSGLSLFVVLLAERLQEVHMESEQGWGQPHPPCPLHAHPLELAQARERGLAWRCPATEQAIGDLGRLRRGPACVRPSPA